MKKTQISVLNGAAFLMATSAIGPGFLTQTTVFTTKLSTSFGFVILLSIVLDVVVQLNIWRVLCIEGKYAQILANQVFKGSGTLLSILIFIGGLAFNIGNVAGAGLGLEAAFGLPVLWGAVISAAIAMGIFSLKNSGGAMDVFSKILGIFIFLLIVALCFQSSPPLGDALLGTLTPKTFDALATVTLVGGTVGGYITFAGAHRLIDAGIIGEANLPLINLSATRGIVLTGVIRFLLFLGVLGVVVTHGALNAQNPPADVFRLAFGEIGFRFFGLLMWAAAITSIIGSAYTTVSFIKTLHPILENQKQATTTIFIATSTIIFCTIGKPVDLLVIVGYLNGLILPISMGLLLWASRKVLRKDLQKPLLWWAGCAMVLVMLGLVVYQVVQLF